jgi:hypothetical protein
MGVVAGAVGGVIALIVCLAVYKYKAQLFSCGSGGNSSGSRKNPYDYKNLSTKGASSGAIRDGYAFNAKNGDLDFGDAYTAL